ncbi:uncharacterized protein LOC130591517 [Beta vulgaris subsp. vulgaris]|uniref:uncharacterized protein LOC130591517 n=1 Tax=Beta vulgaris subsp. vulgaris TaxID=3555 RepID=UPI0025496958|nr:uncharacterized protein LOC130591517 [Beta vulgaris subsp. vulgaris]
MSMEQLGTHLRIEEGIRAQDGVKDTTPSIPKSTVNLVEVGGSSKTKKSNNNNNNYNKTNVANKKRKTLTCWICNGPHLKRDCPSNNKKKTKKHNLVLFKTKVDDSWWIDSGASRHVCNNKDFFKSLKDLDDGPILYMGNDSTVKAKGIGQVELLLTSGKTLTLRDVVYVPEVRKNLVSEVF